MRLSSGGEDNLIHGGRAWVVFTETKETQSDMKKRRGRGIVCVHVNEHNHSDVLLLEYYAWCSRAPAHRYMSCTFSCARAPSLPLPLFHAGLIIPCRIACTWDAFSR